MAGLDIVPVIDLMAGEVVHARAGERERYAPLRSALAATARPADVVAGLLALHPFSRLYVADLDAIRGTGEHRRTIRELAATFPALELWVDAGFRRACEARSFLDAGLGQLVLGSESQDGAALLTALAGEPRLVLSLDYRGDEALGPPAVFAAAEAWPRRLVVMTLKAVGSGSGPDYLKLGEVLTRAGERQVYAAGGVRGAEDLERLAALGCAGVLVASALHDGRLGRDALEAVAAGPETRGEQAGDGRSASGR